MKKGNEKIKKNNIKNSLTRLIAFQSIYQYFFYKKELDIVSIKEDLIDCYILDINKNSTASSFRKKVNLNLLNILTQNVIEKIDDLDDELATFLKKSTDLMLLNILRLGAFELKYIPSVPTKVVINEYTDLAGCFFDLKRISFINSVLDNMAFKLRKE